MQSMEWREMEQGGSCMTPLPETTGIDTLADLVGVTDRRIRQLADDGSIPTGKKGQWPFTETVKKLFTLYREMAADNTEEMKREKLRKMTADADTAQMAAARESGEIMLTTDAAALWGDRIVTLRQHVERAKYISEADRKRLLTELSGLKFENED